MTKQEALSRWRQLSEGQDPLEHMRAIPYKATGSSYGACGVRIDGNPEFIDAVLSCLKPLLEGENTRTRLELSRQAVDGKGLGKVFNKAEEGAEVCYIRLHERGREGQIAAEVFGLSQAPAERPAVRQVPDPVPAVVPQAEASEQETVFRALKQHSAKMTTDDLCNITEVPPARVNAALMLLEMAGRARRYPGNYYAAAV